MKIKKKPAMAISFALGSILFVSTAFAEINSKTGYVQMKDALKYTAESCASKLSSYTMDSSMIIKDNGNIILYDNGFTKSDVIKNATETRDSRDSSIAEGMSSEAYTYSDKNVMINFNNYYDDKNIYYVQEFDKPNERVIFTDPFKEKGAGDIEKIADAIIGNLKDYVVATENADGTKQLSGTLSEAQIPAIANALVSYSIKRGLSGYMNYGVRIETAISKITDDIYIKEVKGNMSLDKDGLMQSAMLTGVLSGKDKEGKEHKLTFEILVKMSDVNNTVVNKPDLTGKKVETTTVQTDSNNKISKPEMYLGIYKNDIVIEKDGKFQKIGERIVDITSLDDKNIAGRYHEELINGNEEYFSKAGDFKFTCKFDEQFKGGSFDITDNLGNKVTGNISINPFTSFINFGLLKEEINPNPKILYYSSQYNRVFN